MMRIRSLALENFRTYEQLILDLTSHDIHLFIGANGAGKTNLLESLSLLSGARSFLGVEDRHILQWGKNFFRVRGVMRSEGGESSSEIVEEFSPRPRKAYFVNDAPVSLRSFVGVFPTVSFLPQDLNLLTGSPGLRRRFLDRMLCQTSGEYLQHFIEYGRCLKQRSALLRRIARDEGQKPELDVWDIQIALHGSVVTRARLAWIQYINDALREKINALGLSSGNASLTYKRESTAHTHEELVRELRDLLSRGHDRDIRLQATSTGPHRDDWILMTDEHQADTWMSRGEQRVCIVALFLLQAEYISSVRREQPVILLDDVFSELDTLHQQSICEHLSGHQIFITSTHPSPMHTDHWLMWEVERGMIRLPANAHAMRHISPAPGHRRHHQAVEEH